MLWSQAADPVLDSLRAPLPAKASVREQAERLQHILWYIFLTEQVGYDDLPQQLDSLAQCCISGKTGNPAFEKNIRAEVALFKGSSILFEQPETARPFFEAAIQQYAALGDSAKMALCYMQLCTVMSGMGDSIAFSKVYAKANLLAKSLKDPDFSALFYCNLGVACYDLERYTDATSNYYKALALIEKYQTASLLEGQSFLFHNIAGVYSRLGDTEHALEYTQKAIQSAKKMNQDLTSHLSTLGWIYLDRKEYQAALESFKMSNPHDASPQNLGIIAESTYGMAKCYRNLGQIKEALALARKAVQLLPVSKNVHFGSAALYELAACEFAAGLTEPSLKNALLAYETFLGGKNNRGAAESSELLSQLYKSKGDFHNALKYSELRYFYQSQIDRRQSTRQLAFGEFTRENEVKTARREAEVQAQMLQQRNIRYALFAGLAVLTLLSFLFFNRFRLKQKTARQLEAKNLEVEAARTRAEQERARAEASEAFKSRFLANMSHEIRTPLHGIAGFTDLLLETSLSQKQRHWLASIHHSTDRLGEVVNDILDLSKLEAGEVKLRQIPFSPARVATDVYEALQLRAENKGIQLHLDIKENANVTVLGDPTRIYQILMNLVGNAVKFTEKGAVRLALNVVEQAGDKRVAIEFAVSDTGIGIPADKLQVIFDSFQQADENTTARFGGTGLGLSIARELVQLHGSDIKVESEWGKGAAFSFVIDFPVTDAVAHNLELKAESLFFTQQLRILLADDNDLNREIATEAIYRHFENAEIVEAVNGKEVLEWVQKQHFDLILMDMQMPEMSGTEASRYIRQQLFSEIPIIALTASATPDEIENALASGMNRHLGKPFKQAELARAIAGVMNFDVKEGAISGPTTPDIQETMEDSEGFDLSFLREFCDGDEEQMRQFLQKFHDRCSTEIDRFQNALRAADPHAVYQVAHAFRPQLEFVGLKKAAAIMQEIETGAHNGQDLSALQELFARFQASLPG